MRYNIITRLVGAGKMLPAGMLARGFLAGRGYGRGHKFSVLWAGIFVPRGAGMGARKITCARQPCGFYQF